MFLLGAFDLTAKDNVRRGFTTCWIPDSYMLGNVTSVGDIAVCRLDKPVKFTKKIRSICVSTKYVGKTSVTLIGFGQVNGTGGSTDRTHLESASVCHKLYFPNLILFPAIPCVVPERAQNKCATYFLYYLREWQWWTRSVVRLLLDSRSVTFAPNYSTRKANGLNKRMEILAVNIFNLNSYNTQWRKFKWRAHTGPLFTTSKKKFNLVVTINISRYFITSLLVAGNLNIFCTY